MRKGATVRPELLCKKGGSSDCLWAKRPEQDWRVALGTNPGSMGPTQTSCCPGVTGCEDPGGGRSSSCGPRALPGGLSMGAHGLGGAKHSGLFIILSPFIRDCPQEQNRGRAGVVDRLAPSLGPLRDRGSTSSPVPSRAPARRPFPRTCSRGSEALALPARSWLLLSRQWSS